MSEGQEDKGFKVVDRRHASATEPAAGEAPEPPPAQEDLQPIDFSTLCLSLSTSALIHLGVMTHPETGKVEPHLPLARQTIDTLGMLEEKTRGNLTKDEARLLEHLLYDLRVKYVEAGKKGS